MSEVIQYAESLLTQAWGDLSQVVRTDAKKAVSFVTAAFHQFDEDQFAILARTAEETVADFRANPLEILTPEQEMTRLLSYLGEQEVVELEKVTPEVAGYFLATAKLANPAPTVTPQPASPPAEPIAPVADQPAPQPQPAASA